MEMWGPGVFTRRGQMCEASNSEEKKKNFHMRQNSWLSQRWKGKQLDLSTNTNAM